MRAEFSAWREGAWIYVPLLAVGGGLLVFLGVPGPGYWALPIVLAGAFTLFFFRDPPRRISAAPNEVVSPADGTVVGVETLPDSPYYEGPCLRISIFLSLFSVHVNRSPYAGRVVRVKHESGRHMNAMRTASGDKNESKALWIDTERGPMTVRQVTGAVARRIVCVAGEGDTLEKGGRFGMIRFGSRTELYLPPDAEICVKMKDGVRAGASIVARFS